MATLRVTVNQTLCIGSADCVGIAPQVFELKSNGLADVLNPSGDTEEKVLEAAEKCPATAILVEDADTGEQLFP